MKRLIPLFFVALATAGCGTLFNSKIKTIDMISSPTEAEVWIDGTRRGTTPLTVELDNRTSHTVVFRKEGHWPVLCDVNASTEARWVILDVLFGSLFAVTVDAATGGWREISQDACHAVLRAAPGVDPEGSDS